MNGRDEQDKKIKDYIDKFLSDKPQVLKYYNSSLYNTTYGTRRIYITNVYKFLIFLKGNYEINIENINDFKSVKLFHFNTYIEEMEYCSDSYKATTVYSIKHFFKFLKNNDFIDVDPAENFKAPKDKKLHKITSLDLNEIEKVKSNILNGVGSDRCIKQHQKWINRDMAIVMLGLMTGLRLSEIINIDITDINFKESKINLIEKGNSEREIYISNGLMDIISSWISDRAIFLKDIPYSVNALFVSKNKERISADAVRTLVRKYTYNIDKHITPHKLRSTCATNLYNETGDIYLTAHVLGHRNVQNTRRYANVDEEKVKKVANILENIMM